MLQQRASASCAVGVCPNVHKLSAAITLAATLALFRFKVGVMPLLAMCALVGLTLSQAIPHIS